AELRGALDQGAAADRVVLDERPDVPALVAAHRADAPGVEALEERDVAAPAEGLLGAQAEPERRRQVRDQRLVAPPLALEAHEGELAAQEAAHRLDAGARHPAARRVEEIVGPVPVGAEAHAGERSEEHTSELQSRVDLVCRLLLEKKKNSNKPEVVTS